MSSTINPNDMLPRYFQLVTILRAKIEAGEWQPHAAIPSERQLEVLYSVSRTTVRQAVGLLIRQGLVYQLHGKGTYVSPRKLQKGLVELTSFSEDMLQRELQPGQRILELAEVEAPEQVRQHLELSPDIRTVIRLERVRTGDGQPIGLQTSYLNLPAGATLTREQLEERGSLYAILQEKYNINLAAADETLEVTVATPREALLLEVPAGNPLLLSERILWTNERRAIEFVKILYRGDRYRYTVRLTR
jgi:GntR family transcriptional regulator